MRRLSGGKHHVKDQQHAYRTSCSPPWVPRAHEGLGHLLLGQSLSMRKAAMNIRPWKPRCLPKARIFLLQRMKEPQPRPACVELAEVGASHRGEPSVSKGLGTGKQAPVSHLARELDACMRAREGWKWGQVIFIPATIVPVLANLPGNEHDTGSWQKE